jgi:archaellum component FlaC
MGNAQLYMLIEEVVKAKQIQVHEEEQYVELFKSPVYKKWMYERVTNQFKHQRILSDIARVYSKEKFRLEEDMGSIRPSVLNYKQIEEMLTRIENNIESLSMIVQSISDFNTYKKVQEILKDEYSHQIRLLRMLYTRN